MAIESLFHKELPRYLDNLIPERPAEMQKMENYAIDNKFPIIGPASGYLCYQIARMINAKKVFELGSGYGYSTAWFAKAVKENNGEFVHHVVWDQDLSDRAKKHLKALGYANIVKYTMGEAIETLRNSKDTYDLIFNDINKDSYVESFGVIKEKLRPGGVLIIDNMLWSGKVFNDQDQAESTKNIRELTDILVSDEGWISSLIPIRDGLIVAYKK